MAIAQPVSASSSVAALHHQRNLSSYAGSGGVWGLARKVCLFFLAVLGLVLIIRGCQVSVTKTVHRRPRRREVEDLDSHRSERRRLDAVEQENFSRRQVVDTRVPVQKSIPIPPNLNAVELHVPAVLTITVGGSSSLTVSADEKIMEVLQFNVSGNKLILQQEPNTSLEVRTPIRYTLTIPQLQEVVVSSTGKIMIDRLQGGHFYCTISGTAEVAVTQGRVAGQVITISGSGKYYASAVVSNAASVILSGNASAHIKTPNGPLGVDLSGNSKCYYNGDEPRIAEHRKSGNAKLLAESR